MNVEGGIHIGTSMAKILAERIEQMEDMEKKVCHLPLIFAEIFKDEMNANEEQKLYNGVKRLIKKYSGEPSAISAIEEFTRVISGGTSLEEVFQLTLDEAASPTITSEVVVDNSCSREAAWDNDDEARH